MDSFEFNKIAGAILGTLIVVMGLGFVGEAIFESHKPAKPGYDLPGLAAEASAPAAGPAEQAPPIAVRLASADPAKGETQAKKCATCHKFDKGGPNAVGPNLWGVVDRPMGTHEGFKYSAALQEKAAAKTTWTYDQLDHFIANPKADIKGTAMGFAGISNPKDRADVIAYLRTLADTPAPLPTP